MDTAQRKPVSDIPARPRSASMGRRERKKAQMRQRIIDTAVAMFRERGYEQTRVEDIHESLDVSRTTFFRYFPSKDIVLRSFVYTLRTRTLQAALASDGSASERLRRFYVGMAQAWQADQQLARAMIMTAVTNPVSSPGYRERYQAIFVPLQELMSEGQREGEFTRDFSARQLAIYMESLAYVVISIWVAGYFNASDLVNQTTAAVDFFLSASRPERSG